MRRSDNLQPFLLGVPSEEGGHRLVLDPTYFDGLDEVGGLMAEMARLYAESFVQSGRARDLDDALEQIEEGYVLALQDAADEDESA